MFKKIFLVFFIIWMICTVQSAILECNWEPVAGYCRPYNLTPITQPDEVITINGKPSNFVDVNNPDAQFYSHVFDYMPTGLLTIFPNLQSLYLERGYMTSLKTNSLPNCQNLQYFQMVGGLFTNIPAGFLQSCSALRDLALSDNNITTIDMDALQGLSVLNSINIQKCKITCLPLGLFRHTPMLQDAYFPNNMITAIDSNLFVNLPNLQMILFRYNFISYVPKFNFTFGPVGSYNYKQPLLIELTWNPINAVNPNICSMFQVKPNDVFSMTFHDSTCIQGANIRSSNCQNYTSQMQNCYNNWATSMTNPILCGGQLNPPTTIPPTTIPPTTVQPITTDPLTTSTPITIPPTTVPPTTDVVTTPSPTPGSCPSDKICRYFLDQYNRYTCILDGVDSILTSISGNHLITFADVNVRRVVFTNSFLSRIPPILFQKFTNLEYLTVSNCSMSAINTNTFTSCGNLKFFDASSNFITSVDGASFKSCAALEVIDLTGNQFDMISGQLFVNNPALKAVYINRPQGMVLI